MTNPSTSYGMLVVKCFGTKLYSQQFVILDSGRYITVVPKWGFIGNGYSSDETYTYKYFVKDSLDFILHEFLLSDNHEAVWARDKLYSGIVVYNSEIERELFESYLYNNMSLIHELIGIEKDSYEWIETENQREKTVNQRRIKTGKAIKSLLQKYRNK